VAPEVALETVQTRIPVAMPDDHGGPVTLDATVVQPVDGCPCPGVVWNHGFGGSKNGDRGTRELLARAGYVVLSYTSRGFGDTPGQVDLLGAKEQQDLLDAVDWLVSEDNPVTDGRVVPDSVGQVGASYGGLHAWALARSNHPAVRTVVPIATATNLYDALAPGDVEMLTWANGFYATGYRPEDDNYSQTFHRVVHEMNTGLNNSDVQVELDARGVKGRWNNVHVPVFVIQGINDGLFPANQAMEAYDELTSRGIETRLYLGGIGHPPSVTGGPEVEYLYDQVLQWLDWHLKGERVPLQRMPPIEVSDAGYFNSEWDGTVRRAADLSRENVTSFHLCAETPAGGVLSQEPCPDAVPVALANTYAGSGYDEEPVSGDALRDEAPELTDLADLPGAATFDSEPMPADTAFDLAGIPSLALQVSSLHQLPLGARGLVAAFQLDPKVYDVAPDGTATLLTRGAFSEQVDAAAPGSTPLHEVELDAFAAFTSIPEGHRLRLVLTTEDAPYLRPTTNPFVVTVHPGSRFEVPTGEWLGQREQVAP
jgi:ABC-2 type transport system ATP-binding protein